MIRTDRLLVCEFSHLTATPSCAIMLTLGKIGQNPILSQYGKLLYHIYTSLSIYFFQFLPGIFPGYFLLPHDPVIPSQCAHWRGNLNNRPRDCHGPSALAMTTQTPRLRCSRGAFTLYGISLFKSFSTNIRSRNKSSCFLYVAITANNQISRLI